MSDQVDENAIAERFQLKISAQQNSIIGLERQLEQTRAALGIFVKLFQQVELSALSDDHPWSIAFHLDTETGALGNGEYGRMVTTGQIRRAIRVFEDRGHDRSAEVKFDAPTVERMQRIFADLHAPLPWRKGANDYTLIDAHGNEACWAPTMNGDDWADELLEAIRVCVNRCGGFEAERRDNR